MECTCVHCVAGDHVDDDDDDDNDGSHLIAAYYSFILTHLLTDLVINVLSILQFLCIDGQWYWAEYSTFSISDEADKYRLTVDGYSGTAENALMMSTEHVNIIPNGHRFSTPDSDNDIRPDANCGAIANNGWWFGWCTSSNLNDYYDTAFTTGVYSRNIKTARMFVKHN